MRLLLSFLLATILGAQSPDLSTAQKAGRVWSMPSKGSLASAYRIPRITPAKLDNSPRLRSLLRDGNIYLSLQDAIALALENNLDLELERYGIKLADSDVLRSESGALPRGVPLSVREAPPGLGAPETSPNGTLAGGDAPTLNSLIGPGVQVDLSILGSIPLPTGIAVPNLDPQITGTVGWSHSSDIQNSIFTPGLLSLNAQQTNGNIAYQQGFTTGGSLDVFFNNSHIDSNNPLVLYNPSTASSVGISVTQPLLRGFGFAVNRRYIRIAKNNRQVSDSVFQQQLIATVSGIVRLYWDLVSLREDVRVREEGVTSADQFVRDTRNQVETGTAAQVDVTRAQAELSRRKRDLAVAKSLVDQQSTVLKDALTRGSIESDIVSAKLVTVDVMPAPDTADLPSTESLIKQALHLRPEVRQAELQLTNSELSLKGSKSALLPELNLIATAQNNGLTGTALSSGLVEVPPLAGGYGDALGRIVKNDFPNYGVGVQLNVPIRNRAARSDVLRDELTVQQQAIRMRQLEKQIRLDVTNASIAMQQARATYEATRDERIAQEQTVAAESEKLDVGASTNFLVIQLQRDLAAARSGEISSLASYQKAKAALARAVGTILSDYRVEMAEAAAGSVDRISVPVTKTP